MSSNLSWARNCKKRVSKAWRSFYVKRNISPIANITTKLNAFIGYVVPALTFASQVCFPSKLDSKALEKVQKQPKLDRHLKRRLQGKTSTTGHTLHLNVYRTTRPSVSTLYHEGKLQHKQIKDTQLQIN